MPYQSPSEIVGASADLLADTLESIAAADLQILAEFDHQSYQLLYVADDVLSTYGGLEALEDEAQTLYNHYHLDELEQNLLERELSMGEVTTFVTFLDHGVVVRAHTDRWGVYVSLDRTASVDDVQVAIQNTIFE